MYQGVLESRDVQFDCGLQDSVHILVLSEGFALSNDFLLLCLEGFTKFFDLGLERVHFLLRR